MSQIDIEQNGLNNLIKNFLVELKNDEHRKASKMEFVSKKLEEYTKKYSIILPVECVASSSTSNEPAVVVRIEPENEPNALNLNADDNQPTQTSQKLTKQRRKTQKSKRQYVPKFKSAGFAIMIALHRLEIDEHNYSVPKIDLTKQAERYFGEANSDAGQMSNMWAAMKTLIEKELVSVEKSRCNYYSLTDLGRELSKKMYSVMAEKMNLIQPSNSNEDEEQEIDLTPQDEALGEQLVYLPGTYEIMLIIDSREQYSGASIEQKKTKLVSDLQNMGINCQMRTLPVGDFAWICKPNTAKREIVFDFLIERKKTDDLIASIRDQRWGEQKYRLKRCGIPNIIYLIEGLHSIKSDHPCYKSLHKALANAQLIDEFTVKHTKDLKETLSYLGIMTKYLEKYYANQTLFSSNKKDKQSYPLRENHFLTFNEFSADSLKITNFTAKEMFVRALMRFHGATLEKCKAITNVYSTLPELLEAYNCCENIKSKEQLLSPIEYGKPEKTIGNSLSKIIYTYFTYTTSTNDSV